MVLLALDTCTERMIVGLRTDKPSHDRWTNVDARGSDGPANHARDLLPAVERILEGQRPDAVGIALGPGSFTGVRIGLATAKGLAEGWGVPLVGLDNLAAMAAAWSRLLPTSKAAVLPVIDARKHKFYGALFFQGKELSPAADRSAEDWLTTVGTIWQGPVVLSGYQGVLMSSALGSALPQGWTSLPINDWSPDLLEQLEMEWKKGNFLPLSVGPRYLRLSEAEENLRLRST